MACLGLIGQIFLYIFAGLFIFLHGPKIISYILSLLIRPCKRNPLKHPNNNDYAIITGASDGIGLEYARQLAAKGYHLLLLSRTQSKLEAVKTEITGKHSVDVSSFWNNSGTLILIFSLIFRSKSCRLILRKQKSMMKL